MTWVQSIRASDGDSPKGFGQSIRALSKAILYLYDTFWHLCGWIYNHTYLNHLCKSQCGSNLLGPILDKTQPGCNFSVVEQIQVRSQAESGDGGGHLPPVAQFFFLKIYFYFNIFFFQKNSVSIMIKFCLYWIFIFQ